MKFKGRTVIAIALVSIIGSALVTLTLAGELGGPGGGPAKAVLAAAAGQKDPAKLSESELNKINAVLDLIETKYYKDTEREDVIDGAVKGMMSALEDPYSVYMEKDAAQHFSETIEGSFTGIGAEVTMENGKVVIVSPIKGSPAERAGLLAKDVVLSVNGKKLEGLDLNEAVSLIRGPKGTKAKLSIVRTGYAEPLELILIRDDIDVETVYSSMQGDTGIIEIRQFSLHTAERFKEELDKLERQGMKGLVIDVRNNPGGVLPVVVSIAENFIPKGKTIVQVEDREGNREMTVSGGAAGKKAYKIAVLINKGSASASEILAGALQEEAGAVLVGETTFGKGTVQVSYNKALGDGSLVKMTIAKWLTPDGDWIHQKGIAPDIAVPASALYSVARLAVTDPLRVDTIGEQVRSLQTMLAGLGFDPKRSDGYFSAGTMQAVKRFQTQAGLPASGAVDADTAKALEQAVVKWLKDADNDGQLNRAMEAVKR